jgi:hypothetical protein
MRSYNPSLEIGAEIPAYKRLRIITRLKTAIPGQPEKQQVVLKNGCGPEG